MAIYVGTGGNDTIDGSATDDTILGNDGNDSLHGLAGTDSIEGGNGDDLLDGGTGSDILVGGAGNDTYYVDGDGDVITEAGAGGTTDAVISSSSYTLLANVSVDSLSYGPAPVAGKAFTGADSTGTVGVNLTGNNLAIVINGNAGQNVIDGGRNTDATKGDTLQGFDGNDTYVIRNPNDFIVSDTKGIDTVYVSAFDLGQQGQAVPTYSLLTNGTTGIDSLSASNQSGTESIYLTGGSDSQSVVGNMGTNTLDGGGGVDTLIGLDGNDTYLIGDTLDVISQETGGFDTVTFITGLGTYNLTTAGNKAMADTSIEVVQATDTTNNVTGNNQGQVVTAAGLAAGTAATLSGGAGIDTLVGHAGNDAFVVDVDGETVTETSKAGTSANDVLLYEGKTGGFNLADGQLIETMAVADTTGVVGARLAYNGTSNGVYLVGNDASQSIFGAGGNDILNGDRGATTNADTLYGGAGSDTYRVYATTDIVSEGQFSTAGVVDNTKDAGGANDTIFTSVTYSLGTVLGGGLGGGVETLSTSDQGATTAIDLTGAANANTLIGNFGKNTLDGVLNTGADAGKGDTLIGLSGDDTYTVRQANDVVIEASGGGLFDTLNFAAGFKDATGLAAGTTYVLNADSEVDTINLSNGVIDITGSKYAQVINGSVADETIRGGGGADLLVGGGGNDTYFISAGSDGVVIQDTVGANVVNYTGTTGGFALTNAATVATVNATGSSGDVYLVGNSGVQTLNGNVGNNILNGGGGLDGAGKGDTLVGGAGDDTYRVFNSNYQGSTTAAATGDVVTEGAGAGNDTVYTSASFVLGTNVENLVAADQANVTTLTLVGNALDNVISGSNGNNVLVGADGRDYLTGLGGADTFHFGGTIALANADTIADFSSAQGDKISLSETSFAATGGATAFGPTVEGAEFQNGTVASGSQATILYDQATGRVFFDSDGAGATAAVLFAQVNPGTTLAATDFVITPTTTLPTAA
ncbi:calcium-binding protein [Sphingomonas sp. M1-B02]|uniref:calcium-binding protein n=1 Tax=Sphingomonas sp. M1-B02 TaxID=3114300 RepID=UPI00224075F3|nr:calcium-binding protein [Sphingomonas sp. S6-11]UZK65044.1 hypothetical protein OKW87_11015 [Sphingomonas sp. S6-11]